MTTVTVYVPAFVGALKAPLYVTVVSSPGGVVATVTGLGVPSKVAVRFESVIAATPFSIVSASVAEGGPALALRVTGNTPACWGVPLISLVRSSILNPAGSPSAKYVGESPRSDAVE